MPIQYDVVATVGTYESQGQTKYINRKVGVVLDTQNGTAIKLDASFNPAGCRIDESGSIWLKLFPPKPKQQQNMAAIQNNVQQPTQAPPHQPHQESYDPDIPF